MMVVLLNIHQCPTTSIVVQTPINILTFPPRVHKYEHINYLPQGACEHWVCIINNARGSLAESYYKAGLPCKVLIRHRASNIVPVRVHVDIKEFFVLHNSSVRLLLDYGRIKHRKFGGMQDWISCPTRHRDSRWKYSVIYSYQFRVVWLFELPARLRCGISMYLAEVK